eukprot:TRINITY_DN93484_c0_g1_i1.p1 TRINITY_DN93484_c0_g1~~TRINITY_DN93484_c0_g1_i1.p1  ORF type:complete len:206 (+),score=24.19 TRINITY_DN93484_c0_g1_i1:56-673(+)
MSEHSWAAAGAAFAKSLRCAWLPRTLLSWQADETFFETRCADLLETFLDGAPAGILLSQPWSEFFGELKAPDHAAQRVPFNVERYAGNYLNIMFGLALVAEVVCRPITVIFLALLQAVALLAPPEMFDVDLRLPRKDAEVIALGGARLRLTLAAVGHVGFVFLTVLGHRCWPWAIAAILSLLHAYFRTRPWTQVAKERLGLKRTS